MEEWDVVGKKYLNRARLDIISEKLLLQQEVLLGILTMITNNTHA